MQVLEGAQYRLRVKLTNEAGEQLPPENFRVYGGAFCPGYAPAHFHAERTAEEWVLTMPGLKPGRVPWNWQVIAAEYATGVEWLLAAGEVTVTPRHATGSAAVDPGELNVLATLDKTTLKMTVQLGESTAACGLAVVAARNSAAAAAASAESAGERRVGAEAAQRAAEVAAVDAAADAVTARQQAGEAAGRAAAAAGSAAQAAASAAGANADAGLAHKHATEAAASATAAANSARDAATSSKAAADSASEAIAAKEKATQQAAGAEVSATAAARSAAAAAGSAQAADASATAAAGSAKAAAESAAGAQKAQEDAATYADTAASTLANAAKKAENNTFTGTNTFNGAIVANGGINGLTAPAGWNSAVSLLGSRFGSFVDECMRRKITTSFSVLAGAGTVANGVLTAAAGDDCIARSSLAWKRPGMAYSTMGGMWLPLSKNGNGASGSCRVCVNLCCSLKKEHYTVQEQTMMRPIFAYSAAAVYTYAHFNVIEFTVGYDANGRQAVTLYTPIVENGQMTGMREQRTVLNTQPLGGNFIGIIGFLIVRTAEDAYEVFAVAEDSSCKMYKCGTVWAKSQLYSGEGVFQNLYFGATGSSWRLPTELVLEASLPTGEYASMAAQVAQAIGTTKVTDYTFEDFNAKYSITE